MIADACFERIDSVVPLLGAFIPTASTHDLLGLQGTISVSDYLCVSAVSVATYFMLPKWLETNFRIRIFCIGSNVDSEMASPMETAISCEP